VLLAVVAAGCRRPTSTEHELARKVVFAGPVPVLERATFEPGTRLRDGLTVADGSQLIGVVRPIHGIAGAGAVAPSGDEDEDWHADLLVTGDPSTVMTAYAEQLRAQGYGVTNGILSDCNPPAGIPCDRSRTTRICTTSSEARTECSLRLERVTGTRRDAARLTLVRAAAPVAESRLSIDRFKATREYGAREVAATNDALWPLPAGDPPVPLPARWPRPAGPGQPIARPDRGLTERLDVVDGTFELAPPDSGSDCVDGSSRALVQIDGDPADALRHYAQAIKEERRINDPVRIERVKRLGGVVQTVRLSDDRYVFAASTFTPPGGGQSWGEVYRCMQS
jgi:hypothetical protein